MHRPIHRALLILALALSQWLVFAHAVSHPALTLDPGCQICLHAPGIDTGALAGKPAALPPVARSEGPQLVAAPALPALVRSTVRIRGPPVVLA